MQKIILNESDYLKERDKINSFEFYDIIPVFTSYNENEHYLKKDIIGLFLARGEDYYLILNDHMRSVYFSIDIDFDKVRYLYKLKYFNSFLDVSNSVDMEVSQWIDLGSTITPLEKHNIYLKYKRFYKKEPFTHLIPEYDILDILVQYYEEFKKTIKINSSHYKKIYTQHLKNLNSIDVSGVYSGESQKLIYPDYTFFNLTGRPNGASEGFNFSALTNTKEGRGWVKSRFEDGFLVEVDFSSYHLHLISDMIKYHKFKNDNVYRYFLRTYLNKPNPTEEEYKKVKLDTLKSLYSDSKSYMSNYPFFEKLKVFKDSLYKIYKENGYLQSYKNTRHIKVDNHTRGKVFNYYLQCYETDNSMFVLDNINKILKNRNTSVILYTYDSFLIDFDQKEGLELLKKIIGCFNYPIKVKCGRDYYEMEDVFI